MERFWSVLVFTAILGTTSSFTEDEFSLQDITREEKSSHYVGISGGRIANKGTFPYMVSIQRHSNQRLIGHLCGGTLISTRWVATSARCVGDQSKDRIWAVVGEYDLTKFEGTEQRLHVKEIIVHPDFNGRPPYVNDVALLHLQTPATLKFGVGTIKMAENCTEVRTTDRCFVAGWGQVSSEPIESDVLRFLEIPIIRKDQCGKYRQTYLKSDAIICAGSVAGSKGFCFGDHGGALTCVYDGIPTMVGITSWRRKGCAVPEYPGIYMSVSHYFDWIFNKISSE